jgi:hypothetical protein
MDENDGRTGIPPTPEERRLKESTEKKIWAWLANPKGKKGKARPQNIGRRGVGPIVHAPKAGEFGDAELEEIRDAALDDYVRIGKATPEIYAARHLARACRREGRRRKGGKHVRANSNAVEAAPGAAPLDFDAVERAAARGAEIPRELLASATLEACKRWYRAAFGGEWSEKRKRSILAELSLADRDRELADIARPAIKQLREARRAIRDAAHRIRASEWAGSVALPVGKDEDTQEVAIEDLEPAGTALAQLLANVYEPVLNQPALNALLTIDAKDLDKARGGSAGLRRGASTNLQRQLAYRLLVWNRGRFSPAEMARLWIPDGSPHILPRISALPGILRRAARFERA